MRQELGQEHDAFLFQLGLFALEEVFKHNAKEHVILYDAHEEAQADLLKFRLVEHGDVRDQLCEFFPALQSRVAVGQHAHQFELLEPRDLLRRLVVAQVVQQVEHVHCALQGLFRWLKLLLVIRRGQLQDLQN